MFLMGRRRREELRENLAVGTLASRGEGEDIKKQLAEWEK
jgi:hypothetical protein